ncbi:PREDICTED: uncharacterized protein LOC104075125, partial [Fulmarus glacialis]|uniref:uncharacterized protein LOC104075125 n=1 Tax=Fulmarus glacialis TaxID=30455 RepID=UPI00051C3FE1
MTKCVEKVRGITHHMKWAYQNWEEVRCDSPLLSANGVSGDGDLDPRTATAWFCVQKEDEEGNNKARKYLTCCEHHEKREEVGSGSGKNGEGETGVDVLHSSLSSSLCALYHCNVDSGSADKLLSCVRMAELKLRDQNHLRQGKHRFSFLRGAKRALQQRAGGGPGLGQQAGCSPPGLREASLLAASPSLRIALLQRVAELEKVNAEFLRTKQQLEQEFNQKRAKFKELYLAKEEDLKRQNAVLQAAQDDLGQLRTQLMEAHAEMENIKAIATVSENTKQEAIDEVKRQWQEEVASLQAVMK